MIKRLKLLGWVLAWLMFFWWAFWLTLDGRILERLIERQVNPQLEFGRLDLQGVETTWFGLKAETVVFIGNSALPLLQVQELSLSWAPWYLLRGRLGLGARLYEGSLEAQWVLYSGRFELAGEGIRPNRNLRLREKGLIASNPKLDFAASTGLWGPPRGTLELTLKELKLSGKTEQTGLVIDLPNTSFDALSLKARWQEVQLELEGQTQGDINAQVTGQVVLDWNRMESSRLNLRLSAALLPAFEEQLDGLVKSLLSAYRNAEGRISVELSGPARVPQIKRI
ncbi:MAG: type II secretion system protein GspN [bacterium]|nr:type II secretion system protein GspN [bacterium]